MTTYDTPENEDVLQEDEQPLPVIPVDPGVVRVDEMPTHWGMMANKLLAADGNPVPIIPANPRRKRIILWTYYFGTAPANTVIGALIGRSYADVSGFDGAVLLSLNAITRYEFTGGDELWARGVDITNNASELVSITPNSNDVLLNIITEDWSR